MAKIKYFLILILCVFALSASKENSKITIFMIGDSTMANKDIRGGKMERGWGMMLKNFFTDDVIIDNHALNGRSSKSFIAEGQWQKVVDKIKPGDYVFIQFGHNDEKDDPKRHTDPGTTFDENLRKFVNETRMRGGIPVLFNSVVRRILQTVRLLLLMTIQGRTLLPVWLREIRLLTLMVNICCHLAILPVSLMFLLLMQIRLLTTWSRA